MKKIFWASDSTVKTNNISTYPQTGMGQVLSLYLHTDVCICNHAENGRSTKKFLAEGRLDNIKKEIKEGDFLFIEFGHNDWHHDPERHTEAFFDYKDNLKVFVNTAKEVGAYPVLITPLYCRFFDEEGKLKEKVHFDYPEAMKEVAKEENVPCIDLCEKSYQLLLNTHPMISESWYMNLPPNTFSNYPEGKIDNAHLQYTGAVTMAGLIAEGLKELGGIYKELLCDFAVK